MLITTDHVTVHALITWWSCTDHVTAHALITCLIIHRSQSCLLDCQGVPSNWLSKTAPHWGVTDWMLLSLQICMLQMNLLAKQKQTHRYRGQMYGHQGGKRGIGWIVSLGLLSRLGLIVVLVTKSCLTLCNTMDCSLPGSSVYGISQARVLEWVAVSFSRGSSRLGNQTHISFICRQIL